LSDALDKFDKRMLSTGIADSRRISNSLFNETAAYRQRINVLKYDSTIIIDVSDLCYAEYDFGNVVLHCRNKIVGTSPLSLTKLSMELNPDMFMKVSRTFIVNINEIMMIKPTFGRNKRLVLKEPFHKVEIEVTAKVYNELKSRLRNK